MAITKFVGLLLFALSASAFAGDLDFDGRFPEITTEEGCEEFFEIEEYHTQHFFVGPSRQNILTQFRNKKRESGFFHEKTFISNFGYNNDFIYDEEYKTPNYLVKVHIDGLIDYGFVLMDVTIKKYLGENEVCQGSARFSGFSL